MATKIERLAASIKRRNAAFAKMSPAQKRVTIAKDVLKQVRERKIRPTQGVYFASKPFKASKVVEGADMSLLLHELPSCDACAVGSIFMCAVARADSAPVQKLGETDWGAAAVLNDTEMPEGKVRLFGRAYRYLEKVDIFENDQLCAMEEAFEIDRHHGDDEVCPFDYRVGAKARLRLIMENVVRNKGEFVPTDKKTRAAADRLARR